MSEVKISCPRCKEKFEIEEAKVYECSKCGTSIVQKNDTSDQEKTQIFKAE
ncbi:MAG: hypothetical protein Q9N02_00475 [Ghiorsea sp.]|nr:hypothetical protein [Ghiorsea sp.]